MAAPDFYFAINATFRWIYDNWGEEGLVRYWEALGREHFAPITERFKRGGLPAVAAYWQEFFTAEPGGEVSVAMVGDRMVLVEVQTCSAIVHLLKHHREIMPLYCRHCTHVSRAMCEGAGIQVCVEGGGGSCRQVFARREGVS